MSKSFKTAFIGSHGVGKTTLCYALAASLKTHDISLEVVREVARRCPLPLNRETTLAAQSWILHSQIAEELIAAERYELVICDRSVLDNYVYLLLSNGRQPALEELVENWVSTYDLLIHVPILAMPSADGLRSTDPAFQMAIEERLAREVEKRGLQTLQLRGENRDPWLQEVEAEVLRHLRPTQLKLL